jgi:soluble lytic murein transglycosylase-like protein
VKATGLVLMLIVICFTLSSFRAVEPPAFIMPVADHEERPRPLPYVIPPEYQAWIVYYADETGVPVWMAARLFAQESVGDVLSGRWNPRAVSWMGAQGLAQIMPVNLGLFAIKYNDGKDIDPFDPETAIKVGLHYLADLRAVSGSWRVAVMAYNGGLGHWMNPRRYGDWQDESLAYARAILGTVTPPEGR